MVYVIKDSQGEKVWNMFNSYRQWCDNYRRKGFDVFRRFQRCTFELDGESFETTIAQLNFIVWYDLYKVYDWLQDNAPAVNADMQRTHQENRALKSVIDGCWEALQTLADELASSASLQSAGMFAGPSDGERATKRQCVGEGLAAGSSPS